MAPEQLTGAVEAAGYTAKLPSKAPADAGVARPQLDHTAALRQRLMFSAPLALVAVLLSMIPALQFDYWQWQDLGDLPSANALTVADTVKASSAPAIASLKALGLETMLLTGDNTTTARGVADEVGIDAVIAEVLPAGKADVIKRLQAEGRTVAMVGDGVTTRRRWRGPISAWRSAPAPTWRSRTAT